MATQSATTRGAPRADDPRFARLRSAWRADENTIGPELVASLAMSPHESAQASLRAVRLIEETRRIGPPAAGVESFLARYALTSTEGVALMCLAEALLRTPDEATIDRLLADKLAVADWARSEGRATSLFVNAASVALTAGAAVLDQAPSANALAAALRGLVRRLGAPIVRRCALEAIRHMGAQFVMGETIAEGLARAAREKDPRLAHSFDMLGEAACTRAQAENYRAAYAEAIDAVAKAARGRGPETEAGVSIKLSALHPRFEPARGEMCVPALVERVLPLAEAAAVAGIGLTLDAEESERLELTLAVLEALAHAPSLKSWDGLGLAVQAYQKRALGVVDWLGELARAAQRRLMVRLVKGAYWDSEVKRAQERGVSDYPVFVRKPATDVSYLAAARALLGAPKRFYPQFATHNAHTLAAISVLAADKDAFEFQRLHGMGEALYAADRALGGERRLRVYAPIGPYRDLLPYLVRRLLENGANSSFVAALHDPAAPAAALARDPAERLERMNVAQPAQIAPPVALFQDRRNSRGADVCEMPVRQRLEEAARAAYEEAPRSAACIIRGRSVGEERFAIHAPGRRDMLLGRARAADPGLIDEAVLAAAAAQFAWDDQGGMRRAAVLDRMADELENRLPALVGLIAVEGGRTLQDGVAEVREAVDFCRYYAQGARMYFEAGAQLPGPAGETNVLSLRGRGVFACISPWNFPLAIFVGQIAAALAAGNAVVAKPAEETPLIAAEAVRLMHECGVPHDVLHLVLGEGDVGAALVAHPQIAGVAFTGSGGAAKHIQRALALQDGPLKPLIAETGGLNAMIVDSTALLEQTVKDVLASAFNSAGQRCSALRIAFVQTEVADAFCDLLAGAMAELALGDPADGATDIGPMISDEARNSVAAHLDWLAPRARLIAKAPVPDGLAGPYLAPHAFEIPDASLLTREIFGPVLHVVRFSGDALDEVIERINASGYGLTLGVQSRIDETVARIVRRARVGNIYVNRNMVGAVVGCQPFGGEGLSGTGPKAGGPHYLARFGVERTLSIDTTAIGGNASLLCAADEDALP
jgi:RHH-type proline utilization regulon transcriptional repressor/proline dehydrogenase/delta 1-pyrroline-5-carboxylate dehydrogenase